MKLFSLHGMKGLHRQDGASAIAQGAAATLAGGICAAGNATTIKHAL